jgi:hemerythrin-like domain-containing protein
MRPTDVLRREHEHIENALAVLEVLAERAERGAAVPRVAADALVDFFRRFTDGCHHAKEENALFPALEAHGLPRLGGPVGVMLHEHEEGRALLGSLAETARGCDGDAEARSRFAAAARAYDCLLGGHIRK